MRRGGDCTVLRLLNPRYREGLLVHGLLFDALSVFLRRHAISWSRLIFPRRSGNWGHLRNRWYAWHPRHLGHLRRLGHSWYTGNNWKTVPPPHSSPLSLHHSPFVLSSTFLFPLGPSIFPLFLPIGPLFCAFGQLDLAFAEWVRRWRVHHTGLHGCIGWTGQAWRYWSRGSRTEETLGKHSK